jgi:hypothetical protein
MNGHPSYVNGNIPCVQNTQKYQKNRSVSGHMYERTGLGSHLLGRNNIARRA